MLDPAPWAFRAVFFLCVGEGGVVGAGARAAAKGFLRGLSFGKLGAFSSGLRLLGVEGCSEYIEFEVDGFWVY